MKKLIWKILFFGVVIHLALNTYDMLKTWEWMPIFRVTSEIALLVYLDIKRRVLTK